MYINSFALIKLFILISFLYLFMNPVIKSFEGIIKSILDFSFKFRSCLGFG